MILKTSFLWGLSGGVCLATSPSFDLIDDIGNGFNVISNPSLFSVHALVM